MNYLKLLNLTKSEPKGFNLLEVLFMSVIVGIIAATSIPYFFKTIEQQKLQGASSDVYQAISQAQFRSTQRKENWQVSFRVNNGIVQYAYHVVTQDPASSTLIAWNDLSKGIQIDSETDIPIPTGSSIYQICFNPQGLPTTIQAGPPRNCTNPPSFNGGQITLYNGSALSYKRCVIVSTILGALKTGQEKSVPQNGKYCY